MDFRRDARSSRLSTSFFLILLCSALFAPSVSHAKTLVAYAPGIALTPEVLQADGVTPRTYETPKGPSYWTSDLPVLQGDKIKLDLFAATGGSEIKEIKVRLDNQKIADVTSAPWSTVIDTAGLSQGYHFVEAWATGAGDKPQTSTKSWSFYVAKELPARYLVKGSQQVMQSGTVTNIPLENTPSAAADLMPPDNLPDYLKNAAVAPGASVLVHARQPQADAALASGNAVLVSEPVVFVVGAPAGSDASGFAYAISRNGKVIAASAHPLNFTYERVRIQGRTATTPGLRSGLVTLWIWGVDPAGRIGTPVRTVLQVP